MHFLMIKAVVSLLAAAAVTVTGLADIQQPPASDYGPTRKLGRGLGNVLWGPTELFDSMAAVNYAEGNSAAWSYGIVRGVGRSFARLGYGIYEMVTFPFPTVKGSYRPPYRSDIPWINSGYQEFPPELGFETRYHYVREYQRDPW
jgi:putative exosortase-associated protein (TIGR04073 family)